MEAKRMMTGQQTMNKAKKVLGGLWLVLAMAMPGYGADVLASTPSLPVDPAAEQREKARVELKAWVDGMARWDKREARPGKLIDGIPSVPPPLMRIEPALDAKKLHGDASLLERYWPMFLKRHPMTARQLEASGIRTLPKYGRMPGADFPAFRQCLASDLTDAFGNLSPEARRQEVLGLVVWTSTYADLLAACGDDKVRCHAGELMQMLSESLCRFHNPALAKDMPLAPCLAIEVIWPGLTLCPVNDPDEKESLVYAIDRACQVGWGMRVPAATQYEWEQVQLALCKWRLELRISPPDRELAARDLAYAYAKAGDHGRAIQFYHLAMQINPESPRNYVPIIGALLGKKYPKAQAEQQYLAYLKLVSRSDLASRGGTRSILRCRADECREKGDLEQAVCFLKAMDPYGWDHGTGKEIFELEKKLQDKNKDKHASEKGASL
jgi:tetratricopeptide (TPR) repeat protein